MMIMCIPSSRANGHHCVEASGSDHLKPSSYPTAGRGNPFPSIQKGNGQLTTRWCVLKAIVYKGCKPDRNDHRVVFFQCHLGESGASGRWWHKILTRGEE